MARRARVNFIDAILNLAIALLWLQWRSNRTALAPLPTKSLLSLLKPTEQTRAGAGILLTLAAVVVLRAFFYWQIGAPLGWMATLRLGVTPIHFRSDFLGLMLLYSTLAAARVVVVAFLWLALLHAVNRRAPAEEPFTKWTRRLLGRAARWPWWTAFLWPLAAGTLGWLALHPLLIALKLLPASTTFARLAGEALVTGAGAYLAWEPLLLGALLLHVLNSYIYFGTHPFWGFIELTGRNLLRPLAALPLRVGRIDFAPVAALALVWAVGWWLAHPHYGLPRVLQSLPR
jgi:hypothetical protein